MKQKQITDYKILLLIDRAGVCGVDYMRGIVKYVSENPLSIISYEKGILMPNLMNLDADGVIMDYTPRNIRFLRPNMPAVLLGDIDKIKNFPHVAVNAVSIGIKCAEYFINNGFKHFAFCRDAGPAWSGAFYINRIKEAGFETHIYKQPKGLRWVKERPGMVKWLKSLPKPIGVTAHNDNRAQYIIDACRAACIKIPEEVAILGVSNDKIICNQVKPHLSSLTINMEKAGYQSAELLHKFMKGSQKMSRQEIIVEPMYVVERQSTDILATDDKDLASAVQFIIKNAHEPIQVIDVVKAGTVSRRNLEMRFKKILRHSILEEINSARVKQIIQLLLETNLSLKQIAIIFKYTSYYNICRFFKKETGISPLEYRKQHQYKLK